MLCGPSNPQKRREVLLSVTWKAKKGFGGEGIGSDTCFIRIVLAVVGSGKNRNTMTLKEIMSAKN